MRKEYSPTQRAFLESQEFYINQTLPGLLNTNIDYILNVIEENTKELEVKPEQDSALFRAVYARGIIQELIKMRQEEYSLSCELKNPQRCVELKVGYVKTMLFFLKEQAFQDDFVLPMVVSFRRESFKDKKIANIAELLLKPLVGKEVAEDWTKIAPEKVCAIIGQLPETLRPLIKILIDQLQDSKRKTKKGTAAIDFSEEGFIYPTRGDKEFGHKITRIKHKRVFERANLPLWDEAILGLALYGLPHELIGLIPKLFGGRAKSQQGISQKIDRLWQKPKVIAAFQEKVARFKDGLFDNELGKSRLKPTQEFEGPDNPSPSIYS